MHPGLIIAAFASLNIGLPAQADTPDRTVLPPPAAAFRGVIERALADSKAAWPEALRAPTGAPNVLLVIGDDFG